MKNQKGFTLIELLLVLAIIGIISAIAIPALLGQRSRARDKSAMGNADSIIADLVGGYDKQRDIGTAMTSAALFQAAVCGTAAAPTIPQFWTAANPWGTAGALTGYNQTIAAETTAQGTTTLAAAVAGTKGQVQVGFLPVAAAAPGAIASAVFLNTAINVGGAQLTSYVKTAGVE